MSTTLSMRTPKRSNRRPRIRIPIVPIASLIMLMAAVGWTLLELVRFSGQSDRLPLGVTVAGIDVGGLTPAEAMQTWEGAYSGPITLWYADAPIQLDPAAVGFATQRSSMLAAARSTGVAEGQFWVQFLNYMSGRLSQRTTIDVPLAADYQPQLLEQWLRTEIVPRYDRLPGGSSYDLQTLTLRPGAAGYRLDVSASLPLIDAALRSPSSRTVVLPVEGANGRGPGLDVLREMIIAYLDQQGFIFDGQSTVASVYVMDLETGEELNINSDVAMSAASTSKVWILMDYFRDLLGSPSRDEAFLMIQSLLCSNNSSSNLLMQLIGNAEVARGEPQVGSDTIFNGLQSIVENNRYLGFTNSYITAPFDLGDNSFVTGSIPAPQTSPNTTYNTSPDPFNQVTTEDLGSAFSMIYDCAYSGSGLMTAYAEGEFNQTECQQMLNIMSSNNLERLLQAGIPPGVRIAHKNGWLSNVHGDAGIVFSPNGHNYVIGVFVWESSDFFSFDRAWPLVEGISRATWNYFNPEQPLVAPRQDIPATAQECVNFAPTYEQVDLNSPTLGR